MHPEVGVDMELGGWCLVCVCWGWKKRVKQLPNLGGWMGGDAIYRTGSNLAFLLALEPPKTWLNIVCRDAQLRPELVLEALLLQQVPKPATAA